VPPSATALGLAPDRAIRARLAALLIDGVIIGVVTRVLLSGVDDFGKAALLATAIVFLYFFVQEAYGAGKTIGKRAAHIHVVQLDGSAPTLGQAAIRNALRLFDALPLFYASGLVAVMWSGPGLRQRMGDKVASTAVILEPGGKARSTPGWLLPTLTVASVLFSTIAYGVLYHEYRTPAIGENSLAPVPVPGFAGDNTQPPAVGTYTAQANINGTPLVEGPGRQPMMRSWSITKHCNGAACVYSIKRTVAGEGDEAGQLTPAADGWHVVFPTRGFRARCPGSSAVTTVRRRAAFVIHFEPGGRTAEAHETNAFAADKCGGFATRTDWRATLPSF
jgi:uncharacterized RDD family membrane protein YckC